MIIRDIRSELSRHLERDEQIHWTGQPRQGIILRTMDIFMIPFSLVWLGFAIFWMLMAARSSTLFALFGIPFVVVGAFFTVGRFILDAKYRKNTIYGITDDRIIIKTGLNKGMVRTLDLHSLTNIEFTEDADGSGTIDLGPKNPFGQGISGLNWMPGAKTHSQLELIPNVRSVFNLIMELRKQQHVRQR